MIKKITLQNKKKWLVVILLILLLLAVMIGIFARLVDSWTDEIVAEKMLVCTNVLEKLQNASETYIDSLSDSAVLNRNTLTESIADRVDSNLRKMTASVLIKQPGMEGGFYFPEIGKFLGYEYPTSPPPIPVYGPPPRSYDIILNQIHRCNERKQVVTLLHRFDPAVFPLATKPILHKGVVIGSIWARVHIERDMPFVKMKDFFSSTAIISILGFLLVSFAFYQFRHNLKLLRLDIEKIEINPDYRITDLPGVFGSIGGYINKMVLTLSNEHNHRQMLERELIQKDKMATLGSLISGVVHEVKTPLAIIKTRIQIWQQEIRKEQSVIDNKLLDADSFQMVVYEIDRLTRLVKRLLDFSKSVAPDFQLLNVAEVFNRAASMVQMNHQLELKKYIAKDIPLLRGDAGAIEQVFINSLNNSIESMPDGGVVSAEIFKDEETQEVVILIKDGGCGIPEDLRMKIFEPFFTTKTQGVGLGLSICKEIIISHNGKMEFLNNTPHGTVLKISLPINTK